KMQRPASAEVLAELIDEAESARGRRGGSGAAEMAGRHTGARDARVCEARAQAARAVVKQVLQGGRDSAVRPIEGHIAVVLGRVEPHQECEVALVAVVRI